MLFKALLLVLLRAATALAFLPFCFGFSWSVLREFHRTGDLVEQWLPLGGGALLGVVAFALLPKPLWLYVMGHETTHVLWTWLCGGRVRQFKISSSGGYVRVSKANFLITLAPYFFPFYPLVWSLGFLGGRWLWAWDFDSAPFYMGLGITYAFHVTLTAYVLRIRQPDIVQEGAFFSAIVIWLGNAVVLVIALPPLISHSNPLLGLVSGWEETGRLLDWAAKSVSAVASR